MATIAGEMTSGRQKGLASSASVESLMLEAQSIYLWNQGGLQDIRDVCKQFIRNSSCMFILLPIQQLLTEHL